MKLLLMETINLLFLVFYVCVGVDGSRDSFLCNVVENASRKNLPCQFPFIFNGKTYNTCTNVQDVDGKFWCSTRVTDENIHIGLMGYWGHCSEECVELRDLERRIFDGFLDSTKICRDCRHFEDCPWSSITFKLIKLLNKGSSARQQFIELIRVSCFEGSLYMCFNSQIIQSQKCNDGPRSVCCTTAKKIQTPTTNHNLSGSEDQSLGTWKPRPEKNECGITSDSFFIVGGDDAKIGDFPFLALLGYDSPIDCTDIIYTCGGTLINKHYVVTAAHCITTTSPIRDIVLGEHDVGIDPDCSRQACAPSVQHFQTAKVIIHEMWNRQNFDYGNDIALVRLDRPAILASEDVRKSFVVPVCLPWKSSDPGRHLSTEDKMTVAGWGRLSNNGKEAKKNFCNFGTASRILQKLKLPLNSNNKCNEAFKQYEINENLQLCAGSQIDKDSCNADSGGPLIYRENDFSETPMFLVGIVSFGTSYCGIGRPGIYTKVSAFLNWIDKNIEP